MNDFVVTYGPQPRVWCTTCHNDTPLMAGIDGTLLRPEDVDQAQLGHVCGPPKSPWSNNQHAAAQGSRQ